ncbi:MAG: hypothetical protein EB127_26415 [Alphaproteobacteria bacterium]|nr:hypothetical protein [Alphaproteobacteria bacterium]
MWVQFPPARLKESTLIQRIDGIKYNLDKMSDEDIEKIKNILVRKVKYLMTDLTILESILLDRQLLKLPLDYGDE